MPQFCFHLNETTILLSPKIQTISSHICWQTKEYSFSSETYLRAVVHPYLLLLLFYKSCSSSHFRNLQIVAPPLPSFPGKLQLKCHFRKSINSLSLILDCEVGDSTKKDNCSWQKNAFKHNSSFLFNFT